MMLVLVGPTGVGKTDVAMAIARQIPAEIVVVDSMQVYRGMDLGTGKPGASFRQEIPHHGLDLVEPEEDFSVAKYLSFVSPVLRDIQARGRTPILVAGSGLYLRALLGGLCPAPGRDDEVRERILAEAARFGTALLYDRLRVVDPAASERIHPNDLKRIVRALEVHAVTGKPLSAWQAESGAGPTGDGQECRFFGLIRGRDLLYRRIESRIDGWIESGWIEEARALRARELSKTAREALGYEELFACLEGWLARDQAVALIKRNTRRYAKRQMTWFHQDRQVHWISVDSIEPEAAAGAILHELSSSAVRS